MQSVAVIVLVFGLVAVSFAQEKPKVCLKTTDGCESAKVLLHNLRALQIEDPKVDIPKYISQLRELFDVALKEECKVDSCHCKEGKLDCITMKEKMGFILKKVELPECLSESEKATVLLKKFKDAIIAKDRQAILDTLTELDVAIKAAYERTDNEVIVKCITDSVQHVRETIRNKVTQLDVQKTCDFCVTA